MDSAGSIAGRRRERDAIQIAGDYQARALESKKMAQRFWHEAKMRLIERVARPKATDRVLDAGCGSGTISHFLAKRCASVIGADTNPAAIDFAQQTYRDVNLRFVLNQFEQLGPYAPFDWIYSVEVIEHLYEEQVYDILRLFKTMTTCGGHLFLTTPNYRSAWPAIEWMLDRLKLVPHLAGDQHVTHFTKLRLRSICEQAGWSVVDLGTFNGLAPFAAPLSYRLALQLEKIEDAWHQLFPGNLLFCVCRNDQKE